MNAKKATLVFVCMIVGMAVSYGQDAGSANKLEQLQQQIDQLQKLVELQRLAGQPQQRTGEQPRGEVQGDTRGQALSAPAAAPRQYGDRPAQGYGGEQSRRPVTLRPVDTGRSVVTFDLGGRDRAAGGARFQLKTNLLYLGSTLTPNLTFECGLGARTSIEATAGYNGWGNLWDGAASETADDGKTAIANSYKRRANHTLIGARFRYWPRERFSGHFFGAGALFADYGVGQLDLPLLFKKEYQYDGNAIGVDITYGYLWRLNARWGVEFSIGGGIVNFRYDKSLIDRKADSYELIDKMRFKKTYFGPTSAGIKLVFTIQ